MDHTEHLFLLGGAMLLLFFFASYIFQRLKLPSLLAYIFLGAALTGLFSGSELKIIDQVSRMGIILLFSFLDCIFHLPAWSIFRAGSGRSV